MKIFQTIKDHFKWMCIAPDRIPFGLHELRHIFVYVVYFILSFIYLVHVAETIRHYIESILMTAATLVLFIGYLVLRFNSQNIFESIDEYEQAINESEYKCCYIRKVDIVTDANRLNQ